MNDKELKKIWKDASVNERIQFNNKKILKDMTMANQKLDKKIRWRNGIEISAAIIVIILFSRMLLIDDNKIVKFGAALVVFAAIFISGKLLYVRSKKQPDNLVLSIKEQLIHRKKYLKQEQLLLNNIFYWYILPLMIPMVIINIGASGLSTFSLIYLSSVVGFGYFVFWLNQKGAKKFDPYIEQLDKAIKQLEQE